MGFTMTRTPHIQVIELQQVGEHAILFNLHVHIFLTQNLFGIMLRFKEVLLESVSNALFILKMLIFLNVLLTKEACS